MKRYPDCRRDYYDDSLLYCLDDGAALLEGPSSGNERTTAFLPVTSFEESPTITLGAKSSESASTSPDVATRPKGKAIWIFAVLGAVILAAAGFGIYHFSRKQAERSVAGTLQIERITTNGQATSAAISPDGKYVIYGQDEGGKDSLWLRQVATGSNVQIFPAEEDAFYWGLAFSPDSNFINFIRAEFEKNVEWGLEQMPVLGGAQKRLVAAEGGLSYSPDGKQFAFTRDEFPTAAETSLIVANADGSAERVVASRRRPEIFRARRVAPAWSPDGKTIAAIVSDESTLVQNPQVMEFDVSGGPGRPVKTQDWNFIGAIAWTADKSGLLVLKWVIYTTEAGGNSYLMKVSIDGGEPTRLSGGFARRGSLSPDGKWIASAYRKDSNSTWRYAVIPFDGGEPAKVFDLIGNKGFFRWSSDSRSLYYLRDTKGGVTNIWIYDPDKGESKQVTDFKTETIYDFVWSTDGKQLVLSRGTVTSDVVLIKNF